MIVFSNQMLLAFSLYDLRCIILTIRKQIFAFKKGTFAPTTPPTERQEGRLLPPAPLSGVPALSLLSNLENLERLFLTLLGILNTTSSTYAFIETIRIVAGETWSFSSNSNHMYITTCCISAQTGQAKRAITTPISVVNEAARPLNLTNRDPGVRSIPG